MIFTKEHAINNYHKIVLELEESYSSLILYNDMYHCRSCYSNEHYYPGIEDKDDD